LCLLAHIFDVCRKPLASMLKPRGDFAAEVLPGGRVVVMGGETSNGTATGAGGKAKRVSMQRILGACLGAAN
jgi:hypothetical protein